MHMLGYCPETAQLEVVFHANIGQIYTYSNVTTLDYAKLMNAVSLGGHFGKNIRKDPIKYPFNVREYQNKS